MDTINTFWEFDANSSGIQGVFEYRVDYGRSFSIMERVNHTVRDVRWAEHFLTSSWELEGYEPAARDDIERAVQATADLMITWSYIETEKRMSFLIKRLCA